MEIKVKGNTLSLLPERAIFWHDENTLLISDLHLGKISHFRREGIAIPLHAMHDNFRRLDSVMQFYEPRRIIFIGDLFHSSQNDEWNIFKDWREKFEDVRMDLVLGNHDRFNYDIYENLPLNVYHELSVDPFKFTHHPQKNSDSGNFIFSGHIHPVFRLRGNGNQRLKFPCFYFSKSQAILPSFGYFTGGFEIEPDDESRVMIIVGESVKEVNFSL